MPIIDRTLVAAILGPLVGILVANGYVAPANADQITQLADSVIGGGIALVTLVGFFVHHRATTLQQMKQDAAIVETENVLQTASNPPQTPAN